MFRQMILTKPSKNAITFYSVPQFMWSVDYICSRNMLKMLVVTKAQNYMILAQYWYGTTHYCSYSVYLPCSKLYILYVACSYLTWLSFRPAKLLCCSVSLSTHSHNPYCGTSVTYNAIRNTIILNYMLL